MKNETVGYYVGDAYGVGLIWEDGSFWYGGRATFFKTRDTALRRLKKFQEELATSPDKAHLDPDVRADLEGSRVIRLAEAGR